MTDDRYNAHPDDYDNTDAGQGGGYTNAPPSYTAPGSSSQASNLSAETYYSPAVEPVGTSGQLSGLVLAGFIISCVGLLLGFFGLLGYLGLLGLILAAVGLVRGVRAQGQRGKGLAIAGIVLGAIATVLAIVWTLLLALFISTCTSSNGQFNCDSNYSYNSGNY